MGRRLQLHQILNDIVVATNPKGKAYFQPPADVKMIYPCIVYSRDYVASEFANDALYHNTKRYAVTIIDEDPDSDIPDKVAALPMCNFVRFFTKDKLNHDIYKLYF